MSPAPRVRFERALVLVQLAAGGLAAAACIAALAHAGASRAVLWTAALALGAMVLGGALLVRRRAVRPLRTATGVLAALRAGDTSIRARGAHEGDALGELLLEANALASSMRDERLGAVETTALLQAVMGEIDVAVFAFDGEQRLRLVNREGERLLDGARDGLLGRTASETGLADLLLGDARRVVERAFPGASGRWGIRRSTFRERGLPHQLLVVSDLGRTLRQEERNAWQRLIRVLGHELNNSLAPIKSIAGSLRTRLDDIAADESAAADLRTGLEIVEERSAGLARFLEAYTRLARLPPPQLAPLQVGAWVRGAVALETRVPVVVETGPELTLAGDADQLHQLLINLLRNAADAALDGGSTVRVLWGERQGSLELRVEDDGPGIADPANLFVPFFTTKPDGTGVGLALARQIAEAHHGTLALENRPAARGCVARLSLPL